MDSIRKWILQVILVMTMLFIAIGLFTAFIDPLWIFGNKHSLNKYQLAFNERIMKTNEMTYRSFLYDSLLLGNSRTTYIDPREFNQMHVYNYAASSLDIADYGNMIAYAKQQRGSEFDTIILAVDYYQVTTIKDDLDISQVINDARDFLYPLKSTLSLDVIHYSINNLKLSSQTKNMTRDVYGHQNYKVDAYRTKEQILRSFANMSKARRTELVDPQYQYLKSYVTLLKQIKKENPNTTFIIFTPTVSLPYIQVIEETGNLDEYRRWLKETVEVFGEVHHFMYDHSVAREPMNFQDASHFNNRVGVWIAHKLSGVPDAEIPADFGMLLNDANIDEYLTQLSP